MKRGDDGAVVFSPSDLVAYLHSPFASWMDRCRFEEPTRFRPDPLADDQRLIADTGAKHEQEVLSELRASGASVFEVPRGDFARAALVTREALEERRPIVYQAALQGGRFAGYADFIEWKDGEYQVWDAKLARSPKPYYAIQLCCYSELLSEALDTDLPAAFGLILGGGQRVELRVEEFIHYYRCVKKRFLALQDAYDGNLDHRPEPLAQGEHGRWESFAEAWLVERDHLIQVAGITHGQIKKLNRAGIHRVEELAAADGLEVRRLAKETFEKLVRQAQLQCEGRRRRAGDPDARPAYRLLSHEGANGEPVGLALLPAEDAGDVFFDMEGYPLVPGGLEYLFGAAFCDSGQQEGWGFKAWWAHSRAEEKAAFEGFIDWTFARWQANPSMHIYHYADYEVSAVRRLSTRHDTRQDEVDALLRNGVFVDLYRIVRRGLCVGEDSYSLKKVERLYRAKREGSVCTSVGSIVEYANFLTSGECRDCEDRDPTHTEHWESRPIRYRLRAYNEEDCISTGELAAWLRDQAATNGIPFAHFGSKPTTEAPAPPSDAVLHRIQVAESLRVRTDDLAPTLADLVGFHRREDKPMWWRLFDRASAPPEQLFDDSGCLGGILRDGNPTDEKRSKLQRYLFDSSQECKISAGATVMFAHCLDAKLKVHGIDLPKGILELKIGGKSLDEKLDGEFPLRGDLIPDEYVGAEVIAAALTEVCDGYLAGSLPPAAQSLLQRKFPAALTEVEGRLPVDAAKWVADSMNGDCLVIQGPPGCGKTYTASRVISHLLAQGKRIGITSNSHKAINNLLRACGEATREGGFGLVGIKVGGEPDDPLFGENPNVCYVKSSPDASDFKEGVIGGTAWLFARADWQDALDYLFIDEAGQMALANAVAISRCTRNLVLLGDQMQLEQPTEGSHPGDSALSVLQYALKDLEHSREDYPVFHAVVPSHRGLFLSETRRMHPGVCGFISESIYAGRLTSHPECKVQRVDCGDLAEALTDRAFLRQGTDSGIVFCGVEHEGNVQQCDEEVACCVEAYHALFGRTYRNHKGLERPLGIEDFLFMAPYNAQVRALQAALPGVRVGSVDKFQGQEAPVCVLSLCSSVGEYGSRGLGFILDRNRINVAISRAQCLAIVIADPRIAATSVNSLDEMRLVNLFCKVSSSPADQPASFYEPNPS